jgi:hypothetical protein
MKRRLMMMAALLAVVFPAAAQAKAPTARHRGVYSYVRRHVVAKLGAQAPGRNIVKDGTAKGPATDAQVVASTHVLERMLAPPPAPVVAPAAISTPTPSSSYSAPAASSASYTPSSSAGGYGSVPGVPSSFAQCVAMRESTNGAGSSNIYGIQGPGGQGSLAEQKQAFSRMYADRGAQPWAPYDGC